MKDGTSERLRFICGLGTIACTYIYFLIFAQFAFLELLQSHLAQEDTLTFAMGAMGISGILGSLGTAYLLKRCSARLTLRFGFIGCAAVALFSPWINTTPLFVAVAAGIGLFLGLLTVALAANLGTLLSAQRFGLQVGLGTGAAYFLCNVPLIFRAEPSKQAVFAGCSALLGALLSEQLFSKRTEHEFSHPKSLPIHFSPISVCAAVASFVALVWLDSAAFYIIQHTPSLKTLTWESELNLWSNSLLHLLAALFCGLLIDWGFFYTVLVFAYTVLTAGVLLLDCCTVFAGSLYVIGVSLYSTALVVYPSLYREETGTVPKRFRAALVYAIGGWFASAMGIGMARDLQHVPSWFLALAGIVVFASILLGRLKV